jgi:hypothetical protein
MAFKDSNYIYQYISFAFFSTMHSTHHFISETKFITIMLLAQVLNNISIGDATTYISLIISDGIKIETTTTVAPYT